MLVQDGGEVVEEGLLRSFSPEVNVGQLTLVQLVRQLIQCGGMTVEEGLVKSLQVEGGKWR